MKKLRELNTKLREKNLQLNHDLLEKAQECTDMREELESVRVTKQRNAWNARPTGPDYNGDHAAVVASSTTPGLEREEVTLMSITDDGLKSVCENMKGLKAIDLYGCTKVSSKTLEKINAHLCLSEETQPW